MTQQMIDSVFSNPTFRKKFNHPRKDRAICQMRLAGGLYADIAKRYKMSQFYCRQTVRRVERLYTVFVYNVQEDEDEQRNNARQV